MIDRALSCSHDYGTRSIDYWRWRGTVIDDRSSIDFHLVDYGTRSLTDSEIPYHLRDYGHSCPFVVASGSWGGILIRRRYWNNQCISIITDQGYCSRGSGVPKGYPGGIGGKPTWSWRGPERASPPTNRERVVRNIGMSEWERRVKIENKKIVKKLWKSIPLCLSHHPRLSLFNYRLIEFAQTLSFVWEHRNWANLTRLQTRSKIMEVL